MNTRRNAKAVIAAAVIGTMASLGTTSTWADLSEKQSVSVQYGDLDLTHEDGMATLHSRIRTAARRVCGDFVRGNPEQRQEWQACYDSALATALVQIESARTAAVR